jgi:hypothetical protein
MYTFQERTRAKEFYVRYARRRAPHHASWDIRVASNLWHGIRNERQAKAAWQKRSAVKHYLSHGRYNPSPTVSLLSRMFSGPCRLDRRARACGAQDGSGKIVQRREEAGWRRGARDKRLHGGRGSRSGRIGPVPYCTGEGGSWHAKGASRGRTDPQEKTPRSGSLRPARPRYGRRSSGSDIMQGVVELLGKGKCAVSKERADEQEEDAAER